MKFAPGDSVHVRSIGTGLIREVRNGGRLLVEVNGRSIVTTEDQVTPTEKPRQRKPPSRRTPHVYEAPSDASVSLDLHGLTVEAAHDAVIAFINDALLAGAAEARIIHGRSGGRLRTALHADLKRLPAVRSYSVDPQNAGVTIVKL